MISKPLLIYHLLARRELVTKQRHFEGTIATIREGSFFNTTCHMFMLFIT